MVKITFSIILLLMLFGCGKKGDIPKVNSGSNLEPAKIGEERIYNF